MKAKKHFLLALIVLVLLPSLADAQRWKRYRRQFVFGAGVTQFLGDLGGANDIGRDGVADLDIAATRPSLFVGYRYQINSFFFLRSNLTWGILKGDDALTEERFRNGRNLHFRSGFLDLNLTAEFYLLQNARSNLYNLRGVRGKSGLKMDVYLFGGIGFMYFNPKAKYRGSWVALQPLGTEGQGLPGQKSKYSRFTFNIPYGFGIGKSIDRYWAINLEFTMRKTFSDYIDDVSDKYYGKAKLYADKLAAGHGEQNALKASELSDYNKFSEVLGNDPNNDYAGEQRGDITDKDAFATVLVTLSRKIVKRRRSRPKF